MQAKDYLVYKIILRNLNINKFTYYQIKVDHPWLPTVKGGADTLPFPLGKPASNKNLVAKERQGLVPCLGGACTSPSHAPQSKVFGSI
jgi:hypothetical protein